MLFRREGLNDIIELCSTIQDTEKVMFKILYRGREK